MTGPFDWRLTHYLLRAVLRRIAATLRDKGSDALLAHDLKRAAMERVFGFEILPAPLVIAHLQIGLELETLGAPLSDQPAASDSGPSRIGRLRDPHAISAERVGVYLTNALTGWEPPTEPKSQLLFPAIEEDATRRKGSNTRNASWSSSAIRPTTARRASRSTRNAICPMPIGPPSAPAPQGQGLNDLYVRFFRMAERRIIEMNRTAQGVICFISNYSWLDGLSFTGMRERYLDRFDRIRIDCLNGDKYKTGKLTPDGQPDPSAFSTEFNPEGIQVGTAIALLVCKEGRESPDVVQFRHLWGETKRAQLSEGPGKYELVRPVLGMGLSFMPGGAVSACFDWALLPNLFPVSFPGVKTSRDDVVVDTDPDRLVERMEDYFNPRLSHDDIRARVPQAMGDTSTFRAVQVRGILLRRGFQPEYIVLCRYRPFDVRWIYWEPEGNLLDRKREDYFRQVYKSNAWLSAGQRNRKEDYLDGNLWIEARQRQSKEHFDRGYFLRTLADNFGSGLSNFFPLYLQSPGSSLIEGRGCKPNVRDGA